MRVFFLMLVGTLVVIGFMVGAFFVYRWFNWTYVYEENATVLVCDMVKPEALKEPCQ